MRSLCYSINMIRPIPWSLLNLNGILRSWGAIYSQIVNKQWCTVVTHCISFVDYYQLCMRHCCSFSIDHQHLMPITVQSEWHFPFRIILCLHVVTYIHVEYINKYKTMDVFNIYIRQLFNNQSITYIVERKICSRFHFQ